MDGKIVYKDGREEILKYGITKVAEKAYYETNDIVSVVLPDSVKIIGKYAFMDCSSLASITIPNSVKKIEIFAFYRVSNLKEICYRGTRLEWNSIAIDLFNDGVCRENINYFYKSFIDLTEQAKRDAKENTHTTAKAEVEAKAIAEARAKADAFAKAQAEAKAKAELEAKAAAEAKAKAEAELRVFTEARIKAEEEAKKAAEARALADRKLKEQIEARIAAEKRAEAEEKARIEAEKRVQEAVSARIEAEEKAEIAEKERIEAEALLVQFLEELAKGKGEELLEKLEPVNFETKNVPLAVQALLNGKIIYENGEEEDIPHNKSEITAYEYARKDVKAVILPGRVTSIGSDAFYRCGKLESITIPKSVMSIGDGAFAGCDNLKDIYYTGSSQEWERITIGAENKKLSSGWGKATMHYNCK